LRQPGRSLCISRAWAGCARLSPRGIGLGHDVQLDARTHEAPCLYGLHDQFEHFGNIERLQDVIERPHFGGFDSGLVVPKAVMIITGNKGSMRRMLLKVSSPFHAREPNIHYNEVEFMGTDHLQCSFRRSQPS